jgi:hypothetical protein
LSQICACALPAAKAKQARKARKTFAITTSSPTASHLCDFAWGL